MKGKMIKATIKVAFSFVKRGEYHFTTIKDNVVFQYSS